MIMTQEFNSVTAEIANLVGAELCAEVVPILLVPQEHFDFLVSDLGQMRLTNMKPEFECGIVLSFELNGVILKLKD
jgi:hypothetical protein